MKKDSKIFERFNATNYAGRFQYLKITVFRENKMVT